MTCRYSGADWRDVFYNAIRGADGGVVEAAKFLTERRERFIHAEDLRRRLRRADGESLSTEMLELLAEWLLDRREPGALRWLQVFNARFGMAAAHLPPPPEGGWACEATAIQKKIMQITAENGLLANIGMRVTEDKRLDDQECDELEAQCMQIIELVFRLRRNARRAAGRSEDFT